ncbi:long-chain fatty alcohol dehydrogenase [Durotheca rogersii]|uniref:long-chain fatty alcohol dehydrogenase n=1 Tax=Durotheca rogersii TaxID=419775 RepID=UPI00221F1192|nr:long-chain fatty alcohol dehydrogenase [Durotheca rogersii]KAI5864473.1 long-chain fatty alcohol dehydrogenase [Durotheca rogersii]
MGATHHLGAPLSTDLPELKPDTYFTQTQWKTLFALVDAIIPSIVAESRVTDRKNQLRLSEPRYEEAYEKTNRALRTPVDHDKFQQYLEARPLDNPRFLQILKRSLENISNSERKQLGMVLDILATRLGSLAATGYCDTVLEQPLHVREAAIKSWGRAWVRIWPIVGKSIAKMARVLYAQSDPLLLELSGYKRYDDHYRPGPSFDFDFAQFGPGSDIETVDADVVIVGSGCGGAVCAKVLAEAGHRVVVVDKGYHFPTSQLPMTAEAANHFLYEGGGAAQSADGSVTVLAGSCWGGGGTVNWSACLQLQGFVRQEWADQGLDFFTTQEFQNCMDRVWDFMGASDSQIRHNHRANVILNGSKKLGWSAKPVPQNTGGAEHYCGNCTLGCSSAEKQGPTASWLPAAARAGARLIEGFEATKVLFDESGSKRAVGVLGTWTSRDENGKLNTPVKDRIQRQVRVRAKKVIAACGTLNSPLLLMRSGLKNSHLGRNLYLHPVAPLSAAFGEDIKGWEGGILTSVCSAFENLDGKGHGVKLEPSGMVPYMFLYEHPWRGALQWKLDALRCRQMDAFISISRDRDTGRVYPDPDDGRPVIDYTPSAFDRKHLLAGVIALAKLCYIEGATEIWPFVQSVPSFVRRSKPNRVAEAKGSLGDDTDDIDQGINDPDFVAWLKTVETTGLNFPDATFTSAHQMGTCRMSAHPSRGVVDATGRTWEAQGLYVADASVFPTASGVNPMITVMAIADRIAREVSRGLKREQGAKAAP